MRDDKIVHSATRHVIIIMIEKNGVCFRRKKRFFFFPMEQEDLKEIKKNNWLSSAAIFSQTFNDIKRAIGFSNLNSVRVSFFFTFQFQFKDQVSYLELSNNFFFPLECAAEGIWGVEATISVRWSRIVTRDDSETECEVL